MATYKLIQDIEAEDHILGPLSFRQFVFGLIAAFLGYLCFLSVVKHFAFMLVVMLPPTLFCAFFAFPWGRDQPTETWALAKMRFWFLPRKRVWDQSGLKELVTINVPKKIERVYTDGLSQGEVKSRLQALANTIDSRGWAIKHIDAVGYIPQQTNTERLIDIPVVPGEVPDGSVPADDMLDTDNNPVAQQFDSMITRSSQERRQRLMEELRKPLPAAPPSGSPASGAAEPQWFMNHNPVPAAAAPVPAAVPAPSLPDAGAMPASTPAMPGADMPLGGSPADSMTTIDDPALGAQLKRRSGKNPATGHLRTLRPLGAQAGQDDAAPPLSQDMPEEPQNTPPSPMTTGGDPAILSLSKNDDLNVATLAREAQRAKGGSPDEVVISLH